MLKDHNTEQTQSEESTSRSQFYIVFSRIKRKILSKYLQEARLVLFLSILLGIGAFIWTGSQAIRNSSLKTAFEVANNFLFTPDDSIESISGRTNILLLGKQGGQYDSPELTDTIIFVSLNLDNPESITAISLPRDIWIPDLDDKINSAFMKGNERQSGAGILLAKTTVEKIVGQPIHYAVVVDSSSLVEVVDVLGGVDIDVEKSFVDEKFPILGKENDECGGDPEYKCRYETLNFTQGLTKMDGTLAMKYSRSRQSSDLEEGTDFARAARQQKVIAAIKEKALTSETLLDFSKLSNLYSIFTKSVETDLSYPQIAYLGRKLLKIKSEINSSVLPQELLINPEISNTYRNLYVFIPRVEDWSEVHAWVLSRF